MPDVSGNHFCNYFPGAKFVEAYGNNYNNTSGVYAFNRTEGNGPAGGAYDLGTKPRSRARTGPFVTPLSH